MEFHFVLSRYNGDIFKPQVSKVLEKRTESVSRKEYPTLWKFTDKLNSMKKVPEGTSKMRRSRYKVYGIIFVLIGLFLLIPSLTNPKEMSVSLLTGAFATAMGILYLRLGRKNINKTSSFDKAAAQLFSKYEGLLAGEVNVVFTQDKVQLAGKAAFDYDDIEKIIITEDLIILFWNKSVTVLQKKDLTSNNIEEFIDFLTEKSQGRFEVENVIS